ncbi:MAG TPA: hypothetical protein VNI58_06110 [Mariprofundaceae bacterium]|nr:hypothetical protein [Mariprofundaceae bacterium]
MDWKLVLLMLPLAGLCYWAGFVATARYRRNKHKFKQLEEES